MFPAIKSRFQPPMADIGRRGSGWPICLKRRRFSGSQGAHEVPLRPLELRALLATALASSIYILSEEFLLTKLYVGNLPFSATEDSVRELFAAHGTVEKVALVNDRETGRPRGFGFVEMSSADAQRAMQSLDGKDFGGRPLKVNEAQDKPRGGGGGGGYGRR